MREFPSLPWWPCFICTSEALCTHREPEIVVWMRSAPSAEAIAASRPAPRPAMRETGSARQGELFAARGAA